MLTISKNLSGLAITFNSAYKSELCCKVKTKILHRPSVSAGSDWFRNFTTQFTVYSLEERCIFTYELALIAWLYVFTYLSNQALHCNLTLFKSF